MEIYIQCQRVVCSCWHCPKKADFAWRPVDESGCDGQIAVSMKEWVNDSRKFVETLLSIHSRQGGLLQSYGT